MSDQEQKLWALAVAEEDDSPLIQKPALSKEIAERALERNRKMINAEGNSYLITHFDEFCQVQEWEGTPEQHAAEMFYTEEWFSEPMYRCTDREQTYLVFRYGEIVECVDGDRRLVTIEHQEALRFFEETMQ